MRPLRLQHWLLLSLTLLCTILAIYYPLHYYDVKRFKTILQEKEAANDRYASSL